MKIAILHYSAPPIVGGVEAVIHAHARLLLGSGISVRVIAGDGEAQALPAGTEFTRFPEMDSRHPRIVQASRELEGGKMPAQFAELTASLEAALASILGSFDHVLAHNLFTKHFNLPLTAALFRLLDKGCIHHCIAWCHDISWTSPGSRLMVNSGYPGDLLRTFRDDVTYVVVSRSRQRELAGLLGVSPELIKVIYNGVEPEDLLGLSPQTIALIGRLNLWESDLVLLMPVRITRAKNIEYALRVVAALKARGVRPKLVLTGPPDPHDPLNMEYFQSLQALRRQLRVEKEMSFLYESGPDPGRPFMVPPPVIGDLFRVSDVLFMPSLREGFGMPILEAGLVGMPVICTAIPAAEEIGGEDVITFSTKAAPSLVADLILTWAESSARQRLRRRVRQSYTWPAIFRRDILPLLMERGAS